MASAVLVAAIFSFFVFTFGGGYVYDTIDYQLFSKVSMEPAFGQNMQYLGFGFFSVFVALLCLPGAYAYRDWRLVAVSVLPLAADLVMVVGLRLVFYHYFLLSLPFYCIAGGRVHSAYRDWLVKALILVI